MNNFISLNIKYLCDKNLLSQKEFGNLFGITQAVINTYTSGRSNPSIENIQKICKHFEISIDDFINFDLGEKTYDYKSSPASATDVSKHLNYSDKDKIIEAQAETIATLKKHNTTLEKLVENLEERLGNAS